MALSGAPLLLGLTLVHTVAGLSWWQRLAPLQPNHCPYSTEDNVCYELIKSSTNCSYICAYAQPLVLYPALYDLCGYNDRVFSGYAECHFYECQKKCCKGWSMDEFGKCSIERSGIDCLNGGTPLGDLCLCTKHFTGKNCERAVCDGECLNGGECRKVDPYLPPKCVCTANFTGNYCEKPVCGEGCLNGGTCLSNYYGVVCACPEGYLGPRCEQEFAPKLDSCRIVHSSYDTNCAPTCKSDRDCTKEESCCDHEGRNICVVRQEKAYSDNHSNEEKMLKLVSIVCLFACTFAGDYNTYSHYSKHDDYYHKPYGPLGGVGGVGSGIVGSGGVIGGLVGLGGGSAAASAAAAGNSAAAAAAAAAGRNAAAAAAAAVGQNAAAAAAAAAAGQNAAAAAAAASASGFGSVPTFPYYGTPYYGFNLGGGSAAAAAAAASSGSAAAAAAAAASASGLGSFPTFPYFGAPYYGFNLGGGSAAAAAAAASGGSAAAAAAAASASRFASFPYYYGNQVSFPYYGFNLGGGSAAAAAAAAAGQNAAAAAAAAAGQNAAAASAAAASGSIFNGPIFGGIRHKKTY